MKLSNRAVLMTSIAAKTTPAALVAMTVVLAHLVGCASPSPAPVLLTLPPAAGPVATVDVPMSTAPSPTPMPLLAVRRVGIPEYMVARRVRFRSDPSTLAEWPNTYWAERIEIGVSREFISALRQQLPGWTLCESTCGDQSPTLAIQVDLVPMDYMRSAQKLQASARIAVTTGGPIPLPLQSQESSYQLPVATDTAQGQAEAMTALIRQVAAAAAPLVRNARR